MLSSGSASAGSHHAVEGKDVVEFFKEQHKQIKSQFDQICKAKGIEKEKAFNSLRKMLTEHEQLEGKIVHPVAKKELKDEGEKVEKREEEEQEAKRLLGQLEGVDVNSTEFDRGLDKLKKCVLSHEHVEEKEEFGKMEKELDKDELERMGEQAQQAQSSSSVSEIGST